MAETTMRPASRSDWDPWDDVETFTRWLNDHNTLDDHEITLRILKLAEEVGEAAEARINQLAQNPRKGKWATESDVIAELCDVIITAMVAITASPETRSSPEDIWPRTSRR